MIIESIRAFKTLLAQIEPERSLLTVCAKWGWGENDNFYKNKRLRSLGLSGELINPTIWIEKTIPAPETGYSSR